MKFCPECDNILIPKGKKLYCKACDQYFELGKDQEEYKIIKTIRHDDKETSPIVVKESKADRISIEDRKAYEEFFTGSEESGY